MNTKNKFLLSLTFLFLFSGSVYGQEEESSIIHFVTVTKFIEISLREKS